MTRAGDRLGVAVSGGADSVALVRLLLELRAELGIVLSVVHFNHKIRGDAADADEQFVRELAAAHNLELHVSSADTPAHAKEKKMSLEAAARELRYGYFESLMRSGVVNKVATAHTLDDQAETVLLRVIRGTGTSGLAGIHPRIIVEGLAANAIVRPLLQVRRPELEAYLSGLGQPWCDDATNADTSYTRNRVRHSLLPTLERDFNPSVRDRLAELADVAREEETFWREQVQRARKLVAGSPNAGALPLSPSDRLPSEQWLNCDELLELPLALQRRLVRKAADQVGVQLDFKHVTDILLMASASSNAQCDLPGGAVAECKVVWEQGPAPSRIGANLILRPAKTRSTLATRLASSHSNDYSYSVPIPGQVHVPELNSIISARLINLHGADRLKAENISGEPPATRYNPNQLLDPYKLASELTVRNWCPGDRFWPAHAATPKKIKELLQQRHVTGEARRLWPVVVSGTEVVWLKDFPVRQGYGVHDDCGVALLIEVRPL